MFLYTLVAGILFGLFYALMGLGLNLVFGVMKIVNLAHGDFLMLGAYGVYVAYTLHGVNPLIVIVIEALAVFAFGINPDTVDLAAFGHHPLSLFGQQFQTAWWVSVLVSLVVLALLYWFLYKARTDCL